MVGYHWPAFKLVATTKNEYGRRPGDVVSSWLFADRTANIWSSTGTLNFQIPSHVRRSRVVVCHLLWSSFKNAAIAAPHSGHRKTSGKRLYIALQTTISSVMRLDLPAKSILYSNLSRTPVFSRFMSLLLCVFCCPCCRDRLLCAQGRSALCAHRVREDRQGHVMHCSGRRDVAVVSCNSSDLVVAAGIIAEVYYSFCESRVRHHPLLMPLVHLRNRPSLHWLCVYFFC